MNRHKPLKTTAIIGLAAVIVAALILSPAYAGKYSKSKSSAAWLGVYMQDIDSELAEAFDLKTEDGVLIDDVVDDSPAEDAGIRRGDVIVKFDGADIKSSEELSKAVAGHEPGDEVQVVVLRDGEEKTFDVDLDKSRSMRDVYTHNAPSANWFGHSDDNSWTFFSDEGGYLGVSTVELSEQLADYFGAKTGVLVSEVSEDSPAASAGLKAGDIIVKVEDDYVDTPSELRDVIRDYDKGDTVKIEVLRKGNTEMLTAELDETSGSQTWGGVDPMIMNIPNIPNIPGIHHFDDDSGNLNEDMDQLREELKELKKELGDLKEKLK
ncbi:MAG: PDZ domain-containing protein [candidate division Zixibacteria bacterium]|nr:PDZ domain-containing protein [candidate division Zixibacteria bacterium]MBU1470198.1 PDZ domain-containing protein [candidate division Zixibacteria bacterium]MBU2625213.1 PDZ domain-containing protein [candidate division Zixibacteria bacterium]